MSSRVLTIMITDIKGFTERTSQTSRQEMHELLNNHEALLLPLAGKFHGTLVKNMGDAFMITYESPTNAVLCAVMMQNELRAFNEDKGEAERIQVRIALNAGEVVNIRWDICIDHGGREGFVTSLAAMAEKRIAIA